MKAIQIESHGGEPLLYAAEWPDPVLGPSEALVRVKAAGVNRADLLQARGLYPVPAGVSTILGLELAGVVESVADPSALVEPGDRVCALVAGGAYAEKAAVDHRMLIPIPEDWSFVDAAALPEAWLTAYLNLFLEAGLRSGERVLIHAAGSGVGTAAIQLAHAEGARVFATAGTEAKCGFAIELGAETAVNYREDDFLEAVREATGDEGVDVVLDPVGADYLPRNLEALAEGGRMICIGLLSGGHTEIDMAQILRKSLLVKGSRLRPRPLEEKIELTRSFLQRYWGALQDGTLRTVVDRVFPLAEAQDAHLYVRENRNLGKVILEV